MKGRAVILCGVLSVVLGLLYIVRYNELTQLRIQMLALEKQMRVETAKKKQLELSLAQFLNPARLEVIARRAQYAHLQSPCQDNVVVVPEQ